MLSCGHEPECTLYVVPLKQIKSERFDSSQINSLQNIFLNHFAISIRLSRCKCISIVLKMSKADGIESFIAAHCADVNWIVLNNVILANFEEPSKVSQASNTGLELVLDKRIKNQIN